jgi:hypothetical protein
MALPPSWAWADEVFPSVSQCFPEKTGGSLETLSRRVCVSLPPTPMVGGGTHREAPLRRFRRVPLTVACRALGALTARREEAGDLLSS